MLTIIIPCYNEGEKLVKNIIKINEYMQYVKTEYEILIVNDGSTDTTYEIIYQNMSKFKNTKLESYQTNRGKGYAIQTGLSKAKGDIVLFMDADLSTDLSAIKNSLELMENKNCDIIIGNRRGNNSIEENKTFIRKFISSSCHLITRIITGVNYVDTQCGFKVFKNCIAKDLAKKQIIERFAFDIEYLYIAKLNKYSVEELDVLWKNDKDSKVKIVRDTIRFMMDLIKIRMNKKNYL